MRFAHGPDLERADVQSAVGGVEQTLCNSLPSLATYISSGIGNPTQCVWKPSARLLAGWSEWSWGEEGGHSGLQSLWGMGGGLDSIISGLEPFSGLAYPTVIPSCVMKDHEYTELQHLTRGGPRGRRRSMSAKPPDPQLFPRAPSFALRAARSAKREQLRALVDEEEGE